MFPTLEPGEPFDDGVVKLQNLILQRGRIRLGPPDSLTDRRIRAIPTLERLERLAERLLTANNWQGLWDSQ